MHGNEAVRLWSFRRALDRVPDRTNYADLSFVPVPLFPSQATRFTWPNAREGNERDGGSLEATRGFSIDELLRLKALAEGAAPVQHACNALPITTQTE